MTFSWPSYLFSTEQNRHLPFVHVTNMKCGTQSHARLYNLSLFRARQSSLNVWCHRDGRKEPFLPSGYRFEPSIEV